MRIEIVQPKELRPAELAQWRAHQAAGPDLGSPFLTPDWAQLVANVRSGVRVAVINDGEGFVGLQRLSRFSALGLGAPIADYQGVVGAFGLEIDAPALCRALHVGRIDLTHVPQGQSILSRRVAGSEGSWIADVSAGSEAYRIGQKARRSETMRQYDKKARKLAKDHAEPVFTALSTNAYHFETLLTWKLRQLAESGQPPIWSTPWVRAVLDQTFAARDAHFSGALFTIAIGDRLIAASYFLRSERVLHDWIIAHDSEFDAYSPGVLLARQAIEWAGDNGLSEVDFGPGGYQYKRQLATGQRTLEWGAASRLSLSGVIRRTEHALRARAEKLPHQRIAALPGKAMRRIDLMRGLAA